MASSASSALSVGLAEVVTLLSADSTRSGRLPLNPHVARAVGRGCVVLLTSHLEGYLAAINGEAVEAANRAGVSSSALPEALRLRHSRSAVDALAAVQWTNRATHLAAFVEQETWLWAPQATGTLHHERLTEGITSPMPEELVRYYSLWGIRDVFSNVTRTRHGRSRLWLGIHDLVDKRHAIAHGDATAEATKQDVLSYMAVVETFCERADRLLAHQVAHLLRIPRPW